MSASEKQSAEQPLDGKLDLSWRRLSKIKPNEIAIRFAFGFVVSVVAAVITEVAGPRVGGLFLAFPAILPASLTLLEKKEGVAQAASDVRGAAFGALGMLAFGAAVFGLVKTSAVLALVTATIAWILVSGLLFVVTRLLLQVLGEKQYLPEIPTSDGAPLVAELRRKGWTVAVAESCTGGIVGSLLSQVPGAAGVFAGTVVAYSNHTKTDVLGVPAGVLLREGAVSDGVARSMAEGVKRVTGADVGVGVTGVTGGATENKSPGTIFIAVSLPGGRVHVKKLDGDQGPGRNVEKAVRAALDETLAEVRSLNVKGVSIAHSQTVHVQRPVS